MKDPSAVIQEFKSLKPAQEWSFAQSKNSERNALTHGYHRYPAKFSPQIVKKLLIDYTEPGETVVDPFGGCGTTLVEAKILGRKSIGLDINPVAKLITQTKVTPIKPSRLQSARRRFLVNQKKTKAARLKHHQRIDYWFDKKTVKELDRIYASIQKITDPTVKRFFLCAFSHILKNCSRWLMKSIKPTIDKRKNLPSPLTTFLFHLDVMIKRNESFYGALNDQNHSTVEAKMYRRDSTKKMPIHTESVDLIVTSPPYVTSYEYADLHQLSLLWFGDDLKNFKRWKNYTHEYDSFRKTFIGTSIKKKAQHNIGLLCKSPLANSIVSKIQKRDPSLAVDVANYYIDMERVFCEMHRILKRNGKACIIIGNTKLRDVDIQNAQVAAEQMMLLGFKKIRFIKRKLSNKMIAPWRDRENGKFTSLDNPMKRRVYAFEYLIIMQK